MSKRMAFVKFAIDCEDLKKEGNNFICKARKDKCTKKGCKKFVDPDQKTNKLH